MKRSGLSLLLAVLIGLAALFVVRTASVSNHKARLRNESKNDFHFFSRAPEKEPTVSAAAHEAWKQLAGYWQGFLTDDGEDGLRLIYRITEKYGEAYVYSLDQGGAMIPASAAAFWPGSKTLRLYFDTIGGVYKASVDPSSQKMSGKWSQGHPIPLEMHHFQPDDVREVPREFRFLVDKIVTGKADEIQQLSGFWSGYIDDDDEENAGREQVREQVIVQMESMASDLVEPKLWLPDENPIPDRIRSFVLGADGNVKIVADPDGVNAIFEGTLNEDKTVMTGVVHYDDDDDDPLVLTWSSEWPSPKEKAEEKQFAEK